MSDCWHYKKFLPFRRFKKAVRKLGITTKAEFLSRYKEIPGAPSNPREIYWGKGWKGQPDLFGHAPRRAHPFTSAAKRTPSYMRFRKRVRALGLRTIKEYRHRREEIPEAPVRPQYFYRHHGWRGYKELFGRGKFLSFSAFRKALQTYGIKTVKDYRSRYKEIPNAPSNPYAFSNHRWHKKILSFPAFKKAVRALGIKVTDEYHLRYKEIPGAPSCPDCTYKNKGWKGFRDLFGRPRRSVKDHAEARKARYKLFILRYKQEHPCMDCGESDPVCLDFHHRDPSIKSFEIARGVKCRSLEAVQAEIAKCDVVCANCHRRRHAKEVIPFPRQTPRKIHRPAGRRRKHTSLPIAA
jgi:hypothetical protein